MKLLLPVLALVLSCRPAAAGDVAGTASGVFLTLPADPASASLGGIVSAGEATPYGVLSNPALLAGVKERDARFSHSFWLDGISYNSLAAAGPYAGGTAAVGLRYLRYGAIDALDNTGADAGSYSPRDLALSAGWGTGYLGWTAGAALKYVSCRVDSSADTFSADAGVGYAAGRFSGGLTAENIGGRLKFGREAYALPLQFRLGGAYRTPSGTLLLAEGVAPGSGPGWAAAGADYPLALPGVALRLRAGLTTRYIDAGGFNGLTAGLGVLLGSFRFDYALTEAGELGASHQFGFGLRWGGPAAGDEDDGPGMGLLLPI